MTQKSNFNKLREYIEEEWDTSENFAQAFECFCAQTLLYDNGYALDAEEIEDGLVDGGNDGQIDTIYIFLDKNLIKNIEDINKGKYEKLTVIAIQSTTSPTFETNKINICLTTFRKAIVMLNEGHIKKLNPALQDKLSILEKIIKMSENSELHYEHQKYNIYYCSRKENSESENSQKNAFEEIKKTIIEDGYGIIDIKESNIISAAELCKKYEDSRPPEKDIKKSLNIYYNNKNPQDSKEHIRYENGFVVLTSLKDYKEFLKKDGAIEDSLFDSNVRAYQGKNITNKDITNFFSNDPTPPFWHLNNGITIIVKNAYLIKEGKIKLTNPKIVNGLQTSQTLFDNLNTEKEEDFVLIKIVINNDDELIGDIIKATNTQTAIQKFALFANDKIHKEIEEFLKGKDYFYERKKNFYSYGKNKKPVKKRITLIRLTQYLISIILQEPHTARARPADVFDESDIKNSDKYKKIFGDDNLDKKRLPAYHNAILIADKAKKYLIQKTEHKKERIFIQKNFLFFVMMSISCFLIEKAKITPTELAELEENDIQKIPDIILDEIYDKIEEIYNNRGGDVRAAKLPETTQDVEDWLKTKFPEPL